MAQTATRTPADELPTDPFAWDPDPLVVVSRRNRVLVYPADLLRADPTPEQVQQWTHPKARAEARNDKQLALIAGVTFLGVRTSSWAYLHTQQGQQPQGPPSEAQRLMIWPYTNGHDVVSNPRSGNVDRESGRLRPDKVNAILMRILRYVRDHRAPTDVDLWTTPDGFDAPELQLLRLSEIFSQRGDAGAHAIDTIQRTIPFLRRLPAETVTPLGALHDYSMRFKGGAGVVLACRQWAQKKKIG